MSTCSEAALQCYYQVIVDHCLPTPKEIVHVQTVEALDFVTDLTSQNQIEAIFMNLIPTACGIGLNYNFMKAWGGDYNLPWPGPSLFVQQVKWDNVCNYVVSNTFEHEIGHVLSLYVVFECEARERILEHQRSNTGIILIKGMNLRELAMMGADRRITTGMVVILSLRQDFSPHQVIRLRWNRMCQI